MSSRVSRAQLAVANENLHIHQKKPAIDLDIKSLKTATKKIGAGRKALSDITNKSAVCQGVSPSKKNFVPKEDFNLAEERFLHDHNKCIEERQTALSTFMLDLVLPGRDDVSLAPNPGFDKIDLDGYPEPEELIVFEFSASSESFWDYPFLLDSPPSSPSAWQFEEPDFTLRQVEEEDDDNLA